MLFISFWERGGDLIWVRRDRKEGGCLERNGGISELFFFCFVEFSSIQKKFSSWFRSLAY